MASTNTDLVVQKQEFWTPHTKQNISLWVAVTMLVTTLVVAVLAYNFGYQAWYSGVDPGGISKLMGSIPFDVTFLIGCSTAAIGIVAMIYSIYKYREDHRLESTVDGFSTNPAPVESGKHKPPSKLSAEEYVKKACQLSQVSQIQDVKGDSLPGLVDKLVDNYELMLSTSVLMQIPENSLKVIVEMIFRRRWLELYNKIKAMLENGTFELAAVGKLETLVGILRELEYGIMIEFLNREYSRMGMGQVFDKMNASLLTEHLWAVIAAALKAPDFDQHLSHAAQVFTKDNVEKQILCGLLNQEYIVAPVKQIEEISAKINEISSHF